jgi:hypothetical protein
MLMRKTAAKAWAKGLKTPAEITVRAPARGIAAAALILSLAGLLIVAPRADAHHSVAGQFDVHHTVTLSGVVSKVNWVNPHIYIELTVKEPATQAAVWRLEGVPVGMARKAGLSSSMLKGHGETVTIVAHPARDGTPNLGYIIKITYPDGKVFQFAADAAEKAPG